MPRAYKMDVIRSSHRARLDQFGDRPLDARTASDLDLDQVFLAVDRTASSLGQHALFHRLHVCVDEPARASMEPLVCHFTLNSVDRQRAHDALRRLQSPSGYDLWWLNADDSVPRRRWHMVFPVLGAACLAAGLAAIVWHGLLAAFGIAVLLVVVARLMTADDILMVGAGLRHIAPLVAAAERLSFLVGVAPCVPAGLQQDVANLRRLKHVSRWLGGDPLMLEGRDDPFSRAASATVSALFEYLNIVLLLDANAVFIGGAELQRYRASLLRVLVSVGNIDVALSVSAWRVERTDWVVPIFTPRGTGIDAVELRHPLLANAVGNAFAARAGRGALITGSNMSGKTTFLRTVGVNAVLARTLNTCLATRYTAPEYEVRSCIGRSDDLLSGKSYYLAEVDAVLQLVRASEETSPHLFLVDELFRGTNAVERIAAGEAVLRAVVTGESSPHLALAATHDGELVGLLCDAYSPYHFSDTVGPEGLSFQFILTPGPATSRNAIALLEQQGAPSMVVTRARQLASSLETARM